MEVVISKLQLHLKRIIFFLNNYNEDHMYFAYPSLAALYPPSNYTKHNPKTYKNQLNQPDLSHNEFPISLSDIPKLEKAFILAVSVFELEKRK